MRISVLVNIDCGVGQYLDIGDKKIDVTLDYLISPPLTEAIAVSYGKYKIKLLLRHKIAAQKCHFFNVCDRYACGSQKS